jgi:hypothetical protein
MEHHADDGGEEEEDGNQGEQGDHELEVGLGMPKGTLEQVAAHADHDDVGNHREAELDDVASVSAFDGIGDLF